MSHDKGNVLEADVTSSQLPQAQDLTISNSSTKSSSSTMKSEFNFEDVIKALREKPSDVPQEERDAIADGFREFAKQNNIYSFKHFDLMRLNPDLTLARLSAESSPLTWIQALACWERIKAYLQTLNKNESTKKEKVPLEKKKMNEVNKSNEKVQTASIKEGSSPSPLSSNTDSESEPVNAGSNLFSQYASSLDTLASLHQEQDIIQRLSNTVKVSREIISFVLYGNRIQIPVDNAALNMLIKHGSVQQYKLESVLAPEPSPQEYSFLNSKVSMMILPICHNPEAVVTIIGDCVFKSLWESYARIPDRRRFGDPKDIFNQEALQESFKKCAEEKGINLRNLAIKNDVCTVTLEQLRNCFAHHQVRVTGPNKSPMLKLWNSHRLPNIRNGESLVIMLIHIKFEDFLDLAYWFANRMIVMTGLITTAPLRNNGGLSPNGATSSSTTRR